MGGAETTRTKRSGARLLVCLALSVVIIVVYATSAFAHRPGRMTGGGSVFTSDGVRVTHGFELHCMENGVPIEPNNLEINWEGNRFHLEMLTMGECRDAAEIDPVPPRAPFDTYDGAGTGRYNGESGASARWKFTDAGERGSEDTATIIIQDANGIEVLRVDTANLTFGNHQAHRATP